jgi:hypothetical protein
VEHAYFVRDQRVKVEEIEGVLAVQAHGHADEAADAVARSFGDLTAVEMEDSAQQAFARADWEFMRPDAAESGELPPNASSVGRVFRRENDEVMIGTDRLTVKLKPELPEKRRRTRSRLRISTRGASCDLPPTCTRYGSLETGIRSK